MTHDVRHVWWLIAPTIAVGGISLTAYVGHIIAIKGLGTDDMPDSAALPVFLGFAVAAMVPALVLTRLFGQGPLEYALHTATTPARPSHPLAGGARRSLV
jgi:uncharacterized membrane protein YeiB